MRLRSACITAATSLALGLIAPGASAQSDADRATARALGQDGERALETKDYRTAEDRFRRADALVHAPTLELGLARALAGVGKFVESQETYNRIIREGVAPGSPEAFKRALDDAKREVDAVAPKVGSVMIAVKAADGSDVADPTVTLDGASVNAASLGVRRAIDPGSHALHVAAQGYKAADVTFSVAQGGSVDEPIALEKDLAAQAPAPAPAAPEGTTAAAPAAEPEAPGRKPWIAPWIAFGVGGAGLVFGGITGLLAAGKHSTLTGECPAGVCSSSNSTAQSDLSSYHTLGALSTVGFIVAGLGAATGVVLLVIAPKAQQTTALEVTPAIGLGSIGAVGRF